MQALRPTGWRGTAGTMLLCASLGGCAHGSSAGGPAGAGSAGTPAPEKPSTSWSVRVGAQGGFTGGGSGHRVRSDGAVSSWSQLVPGDSLVFQPVGQAPEASLRAIAAALEDPALRALQLHEVGNMTSFLECTCGPTFLRWSWAERMQAPPPPPPLGRALEAIRSAIAAAVRAPHE